MANPRKRKSESSDLTSIMKKVAVEECSDSSDIISFLAKYGSIIDSIKQTQDEALAHAMMLSFGEPPQEEDPAPIILEIVQQDDDKQAAEDVQDRRQIKTKKTTVVKNKTTELFMGEQEIDEYNNRTHILENNQQEEFSMNSNNNEMILVPVNVESSGELGRQSHQLISIHSETGIIEIHDDEQNQVILPPEFQQPILQLLSTRGQNLKEITFSHNGVLQTIEIVPPDGKLSEIGE